MANYLEYRFARDVHALESGLLEHLQKIYWENPSLGLPVDSLHFDLPSHCNHFVLKGIVPKVGDFTCLRMSFWPLQSRQHSNLVVSTSGNTVTHDNPDLVLFNFMHWDWLTFEVNISMKHRSYHVMGSADDFGDIRTFSGSGAWTNSSPETHLCISSGAGIVAGSKFDLFGGLDEQ